MQPYDILWLSFSIHRSSAVETASSIFQSTTKKPFGSAEIKYHPHKNVENLIFMLLSLCDIVCYCSRSPRKKYSPSPGLTSATSNISTKNTLMQFSTQSFVQRNRITKCLEALTDGKKKTFLREKSSPRTYNIITSADFGEEKRTHKEVRCNS